MTRNEFRAFKRSSYRPVILCPRYTVGQDDPQLVQGQAWSVQQLMEMQAQGLPMPNLTSHETKFNNVGFDEFAKMPSQFADVTEISDAQRSARSSLHKSLDEDISRSKRIVRAKKPLKNEE